MRKDFKSYLILASLLSFLWILPKSFTEKLREGVVNIGSKFHHKKPIYEIDSANLEELKLENMLLSQQIQEIKEYLDSSEFLEEQGSKLEKIQQQEVKTSDTRELAFFKRREKHLLERLNHHMHALTAKVVYRDPAFWNSFFWIDVGQEDNKALEHEVIALNSPVVKGENLVGVIDYVGTKRSRVRLITDASMCISVRVLRGSEQNTLLLQQLDSVMQNLKFCRGVFFSDEEQESTLNILKHLQENIQTSVQDRYLAKGELRGSSEPLWRARQSLLKGVGFNYDYEDEEGPSRDLRTGMILNKKLGIHPEALLKEGDLLVTTGMDGVFQEGLHVALIEKVELLEEGAIAYDLWAKSTIPYLYEVSRVSVLPPLSQGESF
ncbi:MAG: rod shape-determining protein MreC [Chlamydiota bacterium]